MKGEEKERTGEPPDNDPLARNARVDFEGDELVDD